MSITNKQNVNRLQLKIMDITGRIVDSREIETKGSKNIIRTIPLSDLSKGIYFLSLYSDIHLIENKKFGVY